MHWLRVGSSKTCRKPCSNIKREKIFSAESLKTGGLCQLIRRQLKSSNTKLGSLFNNAAVIFSSNDNIRIRSLSVEPLAGGK